MELQLSAEGGRASPMAPGMQRLIRRHRLLSLPLVGPLLRWLGGDIDPGDVERSLKVLEDRLDQVTKLAAPSERATRGGSPAPRHKLRSTLPVEVLGAPRRGGARHLLLLGTPLSLSAGLAGLTAGLERALRAQDDEYRLVVWDRDRKRFRIVNRARARWVAGLPPGSRARMQVDLTRKGS